MSPLIPLSPGLDGTVCMVWCLQIASCALLRKPVALLSAGTSRQSQSEGKVLKQRCMSATSALRAFRDLLL